jgi:hypothetical protein
MPVSKSKLAMIHLFCSRSKRLLNMHKYFTPYKLLIVIAFSAILTACGGGSDSASGSRAALNGGLDCFATGATVDNTTEGSGIALFFNSLIFPSNTNTGTPWTFLLPTALNLTGTPSYNYTTCADKYATIIDTVVAQDRNKNGTESNGSTDSYAALRAAVATSTANFVGLDNFYYAAKDLGFSNPTGITATAFKTALEAKCNSTVNGSNLFTTGVCPNGTFMDNFLWRANGLFTNNSSASFVGVVPSRARDATSPNYATNPGLTWTRGYLLQKYSNQAPGAAIYTAIFDAGSSGTRISFYEVTPGSKANIELIGTTDYDDSGINDFMSGQGTISISDPAFGGQLPNGCSGTSNLGQPDVGPCVLQPLLDYVTTKLGSITASSLKIELFATAGMRTEDIKNGGAFTSAQITNFYDNIMKPYVRTTQLTGDVTYSNVGDFKTINGNSEEGVWSWINLNDVFYNTFTTQGSCGNAPIGNFEVGGSSMQVAFPVTDTSIASDANNIYQVNINGCAIKVYSKSFLGLGADDSRKYMRAYNY